MGSVDGSPERGVQRRRSDSSASGAVDITPQKLCRICQDEDEDEDDLFAPCRCNGSSKYVHRSCLERWRTTTSNPEHRTSCAECKAPYTLQIVRPSASKLLAERVSIACKSLVVVLCAELLVLAAGWIFKVHIFILTFDLGIHWGQNLYHHCIGFTLIAAFFTHCQLLQPFFEPYNPRTQVWMVLVSLLIEIPAGYVVQLWLWMMNSLVWSWEVAYISGWTITMLGSVWLLPHLDLLIQRALHGREVDMVAVAPEPAHEGDRVEMDPDGTEREDDTVTGPGPQAPPAA